jgi:hypothetical protein
LRFQARRALCSQLAIGRSLLFKACPQRDVFLLGGRESTTAAHSYNRRERDVGGIGTISEV